MINTCERCSGWKWAAGRPRRTDMRIKDIPTPALIIEKQAMERNIAKMKALVEKLPMELYPHYKSNKCAWIALRQLTDGAEGITCATIAEAEDLVMHGINTIVIANQIVGEAKCARLAEIAVGRKVTVCVDAAENILELEEAARKAGCTLRVLVEYDVGMRRCGVSTAEEVAALAKLIAGQPHLLFEGIQAYAGQLSHERDFEYRAAEVARIEKEVAGVKAFVEAAGFPVKEVCGGSTGTVELRPADSVYTQLQCGSYLFMDASYEKLDLCFEQSLFLLATVISRGKDRFVIDAGVKSFAMDQEPPYLADLPGAQVNFSEEHTAVYGVAAPPEPGTLIRCVPGHCCTTISRHKEIYLVDGDEVDRVLRITG